MTTEERREALASAEHFVDMLRWAEVPFDDQDQSYIVRFANTAVAILKDQAARIEELERAGR